MNSTATWMDLAIETMAASGGGGPVGGSNDLNSYIDELGVMTAAQHSLVLSGMNRAAALSTAEDFLRESAQYLTTLVLVGDVTMFDDATWTTLTLLHAKHGGDA